MNFYNNVYFSIKCIRLYLWVCNWKWHLKKYGCDYLYCFRCAFKLNKKKKKQKTKCRQKCTITLFVSAQVGNICFHMNQCMQVGIHSWFMKQRCVNSTSKNQLNKSLTCAHPLPIKKIKMVLSLTMYPQHLTSGWSNTHEVHFKFYLIILRNHRSMFKFKI